MFWKVLSWGAAVVMIAVVVLAYMAHGGEGAGSEAGKVGEPAAESGKKFNF